MNVQDLERIFKDSQVPQRYYSFDGAGGGDCLSLEFIDGSWTISYYSERGTRRQEGTFTSEDEACYSMFELINRTMQEEAGRKISLQV